MQPPRSSFSVSRLDYIACTPYCVRRCSNPPIAEQCYVIRLPTSFWMARQYGIAWLARRRLGDGQFVQPQLRCVVHERLVRCGVQHAASALRQDDKHGIAPPFARRHARHFASSFGVALSSPCSSSSSSTCSPQFSGRDPFQPPEQRRVRHSCSCATGACAIRLAPPSLITVASWLPHIHRGAVHFARKQQPMGAAAVCSQVEPRARAARCFQRAVHASTILAISYGNEFCCSTAAGLTAAAATTIECGHGCRSQAACGIRRERHERLPAV